MVLGHVQMRQQLLVLHQTLCLVLSRVLMSALADGCCLLLHAMVRPVVRVHVLLSQLLHSQDQWCLRCSLRCAVPVAWILECQQLH